MFSRERSVCRRFSSVAGFLRVQRASPDRALSFRNNISSDAVSEFLPEVIDFLPDDVPKMAGIKREIGDFTFTATPDHLTPQALSESRFVMLFVISYCIAARTSSSRTVAKRVA
jgi:hypothetical protein